MHYTDETPQFRPVCTLDELASAAADAIYPPGTDEAEHTRVRRQALTGIVAQARRGKLDLAESPGSVDITQRLILQDSALAWWRNQLLPRPPAWLIEIIKPPTGNPRGEITLRQLEKFAHGTAFSQKEVHKRLLADVAAGRLTLATVGPSDNYTEGSKVTRQAAIVWLLKNSFALPAELRDAAPLAAGRTAATATKL